MKSIISQHYLTKDRILIARSCVGVDCCNRVEIDGGIVMRLALLLCLERGDASNLWYFLVDRPRSQPRLALGLHRVAQQV